MTELFPRDVVGLAVDLLRFYEKEAVAMHPDGFYVAMAVVEDSDGNRVPGLEQEIEDAVGVYE